MQAQRCAAGRALTAGPIKFMTEPRRSRPMPNEKMPTKKASRLAVSICVWMSATLAAL